MAIPRLPSVRLKAGREKKILSRYPWVQREEVLGADPCEPGDVARLVAHDGSRLAIGTFNPQSRFPFRVLTLDDEPIDKAFFIRRFGAAQSRRQGMDEEARRELFAEADGVPGLIVDRYRETLVVQVRSLGMERLRTAWLEALIQVYAPGAIYDRSEMEGRREEGLEPFAGLLHGSLPEPVLYAEDGIELEALVRQGLKTGAYLDQRETRRRLAARVKPGERVLDAFCYTGGFSLAASRAGATTLGLDIHAEVLEAATRNADRNRLPCQFEAANVFDWLESSGDGRERFDWIVLDPPAIAKSKDRRNSLKWGIWKLVHRAVDHLAPRGRLVVCSCSYQLPLSELLDVTRLALNDRGRAGFLEEVTLQAPDHPYLLAFPESLYLKCAWVRIE